MPRTVEAISALDVHIGNQIRKRRILCGMSRKELGVPTEVTHQQLQKYERGTNRISASRLYLIARALSVHIEYFYEGFEDGQEKATNALPSKHQRMCLEVSRNFMKIKHSEHQDAVNHLVRTLAASKELPETAAAS